jgi:antitoxin (DNA-binding transcriptional repressor) of toxin-antitoxin stability system
VQQRGSTTVSEARAALPQIVQRVLAGEEITLTRNGEAVAFVVRPDRLRARRADSAFGTAAELHDVLVGGRPGPLGTISSSAARNALENVTRSRASR